MPNARLLTLEDFQGAPWGALAARLRMPFTAREYLADRLPHAHVLLTDLSPEQVKELRARIEGSEVPGTEIHPQLVFGDREHAHGSALLSGRLQQFERLVRDLDPKSEVGLALKNALEPRGRSNRPSWKVREQLLPSRTQVMGVVNVTPDSFSDGGRFLEPARAIEHALQLVSEGADLLDVGGESSRPGGGVYGAGMSEVPVADEVARVVPVIRELAKQTTAPISIDTRKAEVARAALDAGASIVNDISGLAHDPRLAALIAERKASLCVMHCPGDLATMQVAPHYNDLLGEVARALSESVRRALEVGIEPERICVDPGIGFGKSLEHNLGLLRHLPALTALGHAVLVGASRKSFIGKLSDIAAPSERLQGSIAAAVVASMHGASVVRVHDVKATVEALKVSDAVMGW